MLLQIVKFCSFAGTNNHKYYGLLLNSGVYVGGYMVYGDIFLNTPELEIVSQLYEEEESEINRLRFHYCYSSYFLDIVEDMVEEGSIK